MGWLKRNFAGRHPGIFEILVMTIASLWLSFSFTTKWNPEMAFWSQAAEQKIEWREELVKAGRGPVTVVYGGSSTGFGIDAAYATEELECPMVNLGLHAGMGAEALTGFALTQVRKGDTLLVMLEPVLIGADEPMPALGVQFAAAMGRPEILSWRSDSEAGFFAMKLSDLRPGASNSLSLIGKLVMGRPLYRYQLGDVKPGGLLVTSVGGKLAGITDSISPLGPSARDFFHDLLIISQNREFGIKYALPLNYSEPDFAPEMRERNRQFLEEVEQLIPVIWEDEMGVSTVMSDFADSPRHLRPESAIERTRSLVEALHRQR